MTRRYESTVRSQQAAATRERIVDAGCEILRSTSVRDWQVLTIRAVAERAGVNERTVYRHFTNERGLRDAVMSRLETQAGIDLDGLTVEDIADVTERIFAVVSAHPFDPSAQLDPTLNDAGRRQREALLEAVTERTAGWSEADRALAAAMFDVLWSVATYERLVGAWRLDPDRAVAGITWVIGLIESAIQTNVTPCASGRSSP